MVFLERQVHVQQTCGGEFVNIGVSFMNRPDENNAEQKVEEHRVEKDADKRPATQL